MHGAVSTDTLGCPLMLRTNYRCVQSSNITVYVAKCGDNFHKFIQYTHYFSVTKNVLSLLSLVVAWRGENFNKFTLYTHYFSVTKKWLVLTKHLFMVGLISLLCPLMLRTNYRCVQSTNISLDVAKCAGNFHKFTLFTHLLSVTKKVLSWLNYLFMVRS